MQFYYVDHLITLNTIYKLFFNEVEIEKLKNKFHSNKQSIYTKYDFI